MKLSTKLLVAFLFVGVVPFSTIGVISLIKAQNGLETLAFNQMEAVSAQQSGQIEALQELLRAYRDIGGDEGSFSDQGPGSGRGHSAG